MTGRGLGVRCLTVDVDWTRAWRLVLHPHEAEVAVREVLHCYRCDLDGFAILVRIEMSRPDMAPEALAGNGVLAGAEVVAHSADGSDVVLLWGRLPMDPSLRAEKPVAGPAGTPQFLDVNTQRATFLAADGNSAGLVAAARAVSGTLPLRVVGVARLHATSDGPLGGLTPRQREVFLLADALGYYEAPRRVTTAELARRLRVDKSTVAEHLRKAERRLLSTLVAERRRETRAADPASRRPRATARIASDSSRMTSSNQG